MASENVYNLSMIEEGFNGKSIDSIKYSDDENNNTDENFFAEN